MPMRAVGVCNEHEMNTSAGWVMRLWRFHHPEWGNIKHMYTMTRKIGGKRTYWRVVTRETGLCSWREGQLRHYKKTRKCRWD